MRWESRSGFNADGDGSRGDDGHWDGGRIARKRRSELDALLRRDADVMGVLDRLYLGDQVRGVDQPW